MFGLLFPRIIDNKFRGQWLALLLFVPVALLKLLMGFNVAGLNPTLDPRDILQNVDGVPLDSFSPDAASHIVFGTQAWGLALFTLSLLAVIALIRYRALVPLAIFMLTIEQAGRKAITHIQFGFHEAGEPLTAGAIINWALTAALVLALILSLMRRATAVETIE